MKKFNEMKKPIHNDSDLFQKQEFINWLEKTSVDRLNIKDLRMYVDQFYDLKKDDRI